MGNAGRNTAEDTHTVYLTCNENSDTAPSLAARRGVSGSLPGCAGQGAPPAPAGLGSLRCRLVCAVVLVLRRPLGLHRHEEGLALRQVGPALGHVRLCPIQHHSYGMIWKAHTHSKS